MNVLYYIAPSQKVFEDMRVNAIELWETYDDEFNYATDKINRIKDIENIKDNFMYIFAMFDSANQSKLLLTLDAETKKAIQERLISVNFIDEL